MDAHDATLHAFFVEWDELTDAVVDEWKDRTRRVLRERVALLPLTPHERLRRWIGTVGLDASRTPISILIDRLENNPCDYVDAVQVMREWRIYQDTLHMYAVEFIRTRLAGEPNFVSAWINTRTLDNLFADSHENVVFQAARVRGYEPHCSFTWLFDSYLERLVADKRLRTQSIQLRRDADALEASTVDATVIRSRVARCQLAALADAANITLHHQRNSLPGVLAGLEQSHGRTVPTPTSLTVALSLLQFDATDPSHRDETCAFLRQWADALDQHTRQARDVAIAAEFTRTSLAHYQREIHECAAVVRTDLRHMASTFPVIWSERVRTTAQRVHVRQACAATRTFWESVRECMKTWTRTVLCATDRDVSAILAQLPEEATLQDAPQPFLELVQSAAHALRRMYRAHLVCEQLRAWNTHGTQPVSDLLSGIDALHAAWATRIRGFPDPWTQLALDDIPELGRGGFDTDMKALSDRVRHVRAALVDRLRSATHDQHSFIDKCIAELGTERGMIGALQPWLATRDIQCMLERQRAKTDAPEPNSDWVLGQSASAMIRRHADQQLRDTGHAAHVLNQLHTHTLTIRDRLIERSDHPDVPWTWSDFLVNTQDWFLLQALLRYTQRLSTQTMHSGR